MNLGDFELFLFTSVVILLNTIGVLAFLYVGIKLKKITEYDVIHIKQAYISTVITVVVCTLFPTLISAVLFLLFYLLLRYQVFRKDTVRLANLYDIYAGKETTYPPIQRFEQVFSKKQKVGPIEKLDKDFLYSFSKYLNNSVYLFIFYYVKEGATAGNSSVIYAIEFFIAATALFVIIGKLVYHLALKTPSSLFFLNPNLSYIPATVVGIIYYFLVIVIFRSTLA